MQQGPMITCHKCGQENTPGSNFCNSCGQDLSAKAPRTPADPSGAAAVCPRCHRPNEPSSRFCYNCGLPLNEEVGFRQPTPSLSALAQGPPAGFWARLVASFLDYLVGLSILYFTLPLFGTSLWEYVTAEEIRPEILIDITSGLLYQTLLVGAFATTVGKRTLTMYVRRPDGSRVGYGRALGRELAKFLSAITFGIGFLMIAFRSDKRGLHDLIADTVVIKR